MNANDSSVAKVVIFVEAEASLGIFRTALLIMIKLMRLNTAKNIAAINFQFIRIRKIFSMLSKFPEIRFLSPINTIDAALVIQKAKTQNETANIVC